MEKDEKGLVLPVFPKLSGKQVECLRFVFDFYTERLHYPSRQEVGAALQISPPAANSHIEALIEKGYLLRVEGEARNIRINPDTEQILKRLGIIKPEGGAEKA